VLSPGFEWGDPEGPENYAELDPVLYVIAIGTHHD